MVPRYLLYLTIAEDMSGMPGLGLSPLEGGLGFDYRLAMGAPDMWSTLLDKVPDEQWNVHELYHQLRDRREEVRTIAYAESHDQALVGDKCISFRLMDNAMYTAMSRNSQDIIIERGIALHKMIRLFTMSVGGEAYLNFMGNEFGHPEWIDFPRQGNAWSYQYARRQWHLVDDDTLRYQGLAAFDREMLRHCKVLIGAHKARLLAEHIDGRWIAYALGAHVFVFNFNHRDSFTDLPIPVPQACTYRLELCTDEQRFDGLSRLHAGAEYPCLEGEQAVRIYLPTRTALVLAPKILDVESNHDHPCTH